MKKLTAGRIALISIFAFVLLLGILAVSVYNGLTKAHESVQAQKANIATQLQRRVDLIPNLVNTVKGYTAHETQILTQISEARAKLAGAGSMPDKAEADAELRGALSRLLVVVENYPDLKADKQFTALQDELAGTENRISVARVEYNTTVQRYNQRVKTFPNFIFAGMFGLGSESYFQASQGAENAPKVDFNS